jgi:hypothetical protein
VLLGVVLVVALQTCADAPECRRAALDAIAQQDYERAHDLAWRAVQKGKPNDPDLMLVLARAMALSGRPGDALVMLGRAADRGPVPDVTTDPDFSSVRALSGWPDLEAKLTGAPRAPSAPSAPSAPAPSAPSAPLAPSAPRDSPDALAFDAPNLNPFALAHDAVSRRFVLGDRRAHRLLVIDEVSHNVTTYVTAQTAGFYDDLTALTIDVPRGDLWVASARGEGRERASVVHKLQLISGRLLTEVRAPDNAAPLRIVSLAVMPDGTVYALDGAGERLFRVRPGTRSLEQVMRLQGEGYAALAAAGDRALYAASHGQLVRIDPAARTLVTLKSAQPLGGFESLAWHNGVLVGVEHTGDRFDVVRLKIDGNGTRIVSRQVVASSSNATVGSLGGDSYYYLGEDGTIRRVALR